MQATSDKTDQYIAVITGDLVASSKLDDAVFKQVMSSLQQRLASFTEHYSVEFDIFRGDSFQLVCAPQDAALLATLTDLTLRAGEPSVEVRQCIAIGTGQVGDSSVKMASGSAFILSGRGLDSIKHRGLLIASVHEHFAQDIALITRFYDSHLARLTSTQCQVVCTFLEAKDKSHEHLASQLDKKRSNVTRILNTSQYHLITDYLAYYQKQVKKEFSQ